MTINKTNEVPIKYIEGDLFDFLTKETDDVIVPHICNDIGAMGAGFVVPLNKHFPGIRQIYQEWYGGNKITRTATPNTGNPYVLEYSGGPFGNDDMKLGAVQFVSPPLKPNITIANMIGQSDVVSRVPMSVDAVIRPPIRYGALGNAMENVAKFAKTYCVDKIYAPKFGSGLAGGDWNIIEQMIYETWIDCELKVTIFEL